MRGLSTRAVRILAAMALLGVTARLVLAFAYYGQPFDQHSFELVRRALDAAPFDVYGATNQFRWPYPPLFFAWIAAAGAISDATGWAFHGLVNLPSIAADVAIAWIVQAHLGFRGRGERDRLVAAGLVLLGPAFIAISGYHGQIDSIAMLPAVAAVALWDRGGEGRAWQAGLLIGAGIAIKTVPGLMALALLPSVRTRREAGVLVVCAVAVPLALLAPYLVHDAAAVGRALDYPSGGRAGGLGLIEAVRPNPLTAQVLAHSTVWNGLWLSALLGLLWLRRPPPTRAAVLVWLALYVFGTGFYLNYLVWGLSFLALDGALAWTAGVQAAALAPMVVTYAGLFGSWLAARAFDVPMLALWLAFAGALALRVVGDPGTRSAEAA